MKCAFCEIEGLKPAKVAGYYSCPRCGFIFNSKITSDPDLSLYKYDVESIRSKDGDPSVVFAKAESKFNNGKYEVVGLRLERGDYSFFFGQKFAVLRRRCK